MARRRMSRFSRLSASPHKRAGKALPVVISIAAFLALSIVVSVAIGLFLSEQVDELEGKKKFEFEKVEYVSGNKIIRGVEAYHFPSSSASPYDYASQGIYDLSVMARGQDGSLNFAFETSERFPIDTVHSDRSFKTLCEDSSDAGTRVCAYMYVTSFEIKDKYARDTAKAYEIALVSEMAASGADDILLLGLSVTEDNVAEICEFVARASVAADKVPLGVALSEDIFKLAESEIYFAARVRGACDYLALDLTHLTLEDGKSQGVGEDGEVLPSLLEDTIEKSRFYIKEYPARVLFSREHSKLYKDAIEFGIADLQIVDK